MQKSFWMPRDAGCVANSEMSYDNSSKMEPKRSHQWFMDGSAPEVFTNKRQAIETITGRPVPDVSTMNVPSWDNNNNFQSISGQFADRLFGSEPVRSTNLVDRNIASFNSGDMGRKYIGDQFVNDSSVNLSMSHASEDPSAFLNFGGLRKVKINQVREPDNSLRASMGSSYRRHVGAIPFDGHYSKTDGNTISLGPSYPNGDENNISMGSGYTKEDESFISMGHSFSKEDGNFISMGHNYDKGSENILSMGQPFPKGDGGFISMGQTYSKGDRDVISMTSSYNKDHSNFISMTHGFGKGAENLVSVNPAYSKDNDNMVSIGHSYDKDDPNIVQIGPTYEKGDSGILSVGHNYKGEGSAVSFGVFNNETETSASGTIIGNYELVLDTEGSVQASEVPSQKEVVDSNADPIVNTTATSKANPRADSTPKKEPKMAKKLPPNNFPSNVKSLLSTGMLDGVPVKYVSWSREKNLKAIIKGTGYLCGCNNCNHSKSLNAYEFERHAGCKTKHPNNHIYFDNGKTIYAVVQELKNTPQEMLFDSIQTVTGSPINQKNFRIWKASYQAATRELQRIYGTDEVKMPC